MFPNSGREFYPRLHTCTYTGVQTASYPIETDGPSLQTKWSWREADHLPKSSVKINNETIPPVPYDVMEWY